MPTFTQLQSHSTEEQEKSNLSGFGKRNKLATYEYTINVRTCSQNTKTGKVAVVKKLNSANLKSALLSPDKKVCKSFILQFEAGLKLVQKKVIEEEKY